MAKNISSVERVENKIDKFYLTQKENNNNKNRRWKLGMKRRED